MNRPSPLLCCLLSVFLVCLSGCGKKDDNPPPGPGPGPGNPGQPITLSPRASFTPEVKAGSEGDKTKSSAQSVAVSADGTFVLSHGTGHGKNAQLWDVVKKQKLHEFDNPAGGVLPVAISPDAKTLAYATYSGVVLRGVADGKQSRELKPEGPPGFPRGLFFSPKGDLIVMGYGKAIFGWDPATGEQRFSWKEDAEVTALSDFFDDGRKIAVGRDDGVIRVWDVTTGKPARTLSGQNKEKVLVLAPTRDGKLLASCASRGQIKVWDLATGNVAHTLDESEAPTEVDALVFLPDGRTLIHPDQERNLAALDVQGKGRRAVLKGHDKRPWGLAVSADGSTLVSVGWDDTFKVWDLKGLP